MTTDTYTAIDVTALSDQFVSWSVIKTGIDPSVLPRVTVTSVRENSAVLSWRWDKDLFEGRSRNLAIALNYAKRSGIRYLFMDLVTVDQSLTGDRLLEQVSGLSRLYRELDVIAVADRHDTKNWTHDMRRPWMLYEARNYLQNGRKIEFLTTHSKRNIEGELGKIFRTSYSHYVFFAVVNHIGMADPLDFRFIFEPFSAALSFLAEHLSDSDFLFAVLLLCLLHEEGQLVDRNRAEVNNGLRLARVGSDKIMEDAKFNKFQIGDPCGSGNYESCYPIKIGQLTVAEWRNKMTSSFDRNWLKALPGADVGLLKLLGANGDVIAAYASRKKDQLRWLKIDGDVPQINTHVVDLEHDRWLS